MLALWSRAVCSVFLCCVISGALHTPTHSPTHKTTTRDTRPYGYIHTTPLCSYSDIHVAALLLFCCSAFAGTASGQLSTNRKTNKQQRWRNKSNGTAEGTSVSSCFYLNTDSSTFSWFKAAQFPNIIHNRAMRWNLRYLCGLRCFKSSAGTEQGPAWMQPQVLSAALQLNIQCIQNSHLQMKNVSKSQ